MFSKAICCKPDSIIWSSISASIVLSDPFQEYHGIANKERRDFLQFVQCH